MNNRWLAIALGLAAAAFLIYASFGRRWLFNTADNDEFGFGLREGFVCMDYREGRECTVRPNAEYLHTFEQIGTLEDARKKSSTFVPLGLATFVLCLLAAAGLAAGAALALGKKTPELPMAPTTMSMLALMLALITGCVFVATKPGAPGVVGVGITFWSFGAGAVLGIASSLMLARVNRPVDPDLMADAMDPEQY